MRAMRKLISLVLLAAVTTAAGANVSDVQVINMTLQHMPSTARAPVAVRYTVVAPALAPAAQNKLPLIFGLNGYNVEARDYLDVSLYGQAVCHAGSVDRAHAPG